LGSELCADSHRELINSIEHFQFTALLNSSIIENVHDVRAVVDMISGNLIIVALDLQRLLVVWREITVNAPNVGVLEVLELWTHVSKEHVIKACRYMKKVL
jgi:hypothetical protein